MSKGITYCVGVGCGDPELMTLKALRIIGENEIIAVVGEDYKNSLAYHIALQNIPQLAQKNILSLPMPMTAQKDILHKYHRQNTCLIESYLDSGKNVVCLTLGDPSVYSSLHYLRKILQDDGYTVQSISGVTSFCEAANTLNIPLCEQDGELHILPALYQTSFSVLPKGSLVAMKASKNIAALKQFIRKNSLSAWAVENCGLPNQKIYCGVENFPDTFPYLTVIIAH